MKVARSRLSGNGVFATKSYQVGDTIEDCPIIRLSSADRQAIDKTGLYDYYFSWGVDDNEAAIALGTGSLYNHSYRPNAHYNKDFQKDTIQFIALRRIQYGEEIVINYNGDPLDQSPVWFEVQV